MFKTKLLSIFPIFLQFSSAFQGGPFLWSRDLYPPAIGLADEVVSSPKFRHVTSVQNGPWRDLALAALAERVGNHGNVYSINTPPTTTWMPFKREMDELTLSKQVLKAHNQPMPALPGTSNIIAGPIPMRHLRCGDKTYAVDDGERNEVACCGNAAYRAKMASCLNGKVITWSEAIKEASIRAKSAKIRQTQPTVPTTLQTTTLPPVKKKDDFIDWRTLEKICIHRDNLTGVFNRVALSKMFGPDGLNASAIFRQPPRYFSNNNLQPIKKSNYNGARKKPSKIPVTIVGCGTKKMYRISDSVGKFICCGVRLMKKRKLPCNSLVTAPRVLSVVSDVQSSNEVARNQSTGLANVLMMNAANQGVEKLSRRRAKPLIGQFAQCPNDAFGNQVFRKYNRHTHICCGNLVFEKTVTQICCDGVYKESPPTEPLGCCGQSPYELSKFLCSNSQISPKFP